MTREDIIKTPGYWMAKVQMDINECAEEFMEQNNLTRSQLAKHLGVSKGYVSQLLNGEYDHRLSKLIDLALAFGYIPKIEFEPIQNMIFREQIKLHKNKWIQADFSPLTIIGKQSVVSDETYQEQEDNNLKMAV